MKNIILTILICFNYSLSFSQNQNIVKHSINAQQLNETREIWVGLPANYDSTVAYPTIYVLDAESQFEITYAIMKELAINDKIPDHIVVGIPFVGPQKRVYDLTFTTNSFNSDGTSDSLVATYFAAS